MSVYIPASVRGPIYAIYAVLGLGLGATQVGFAAADAGQPVALTVALAVFAFVGTGIGYTAASNTPAAPSNAGLRRDESAVADLNVPTLYSADEVERQLSEALRREKAAGFDRYQSPIGEGVENVGDAVREGVERIGNKAAATYHDGTETDGNPGGGDAPRPAGGYWDGV